MQMVRVFTLIITVIPAQARASGDPAPAILDTIAATLGGRFQRLRALGSRFRGNDK
jgi:hypothetical protein